ncbi:MAG: DUF4261 domain-containing protein [Kiritimatiellia bacterium]
MFGKKQPKEAKVQETMLCIPGPWKDRTEFVQCVVTHSKGDFMFAGGILANPKAQDHVPLEFCDTYDNMRKAFEIAGQGKLPKEVLDQIGSHKSIVYIRFPLNVIDQKERMLKYTSLLRDLGGFAVKIESTGIAHAWDVWAELVSSENPFDQYRCFVVLIGDEKQFYSCGMHHFGLPDCQISRVNPADEAADTMNRFNYYQITEHPELDSGHTFSLTPDSPYYRLTLDQDKGMGSMSSSITPMDCDKWRGSNTKSTVPQWGAPHWSRDFRR